MKQRAVLLAILLETFVAASWAQSSVTLYGSLDVNLARFTGGKFKNGGASVNYLNDGHSFGMNPSRWGIRGVEDLGDGATAGVLLESGFGADDGTLKQGGRIFGRQVYVSIGKAGWGELRAGRQYSYHDELAVQNNPLVGGTVMWVGGPGVTNTAALPQFIDIGRIDNVVQYISPSFGGVVAQVAAAPGEGSTDRYMGAKLSYRAGKLFVGAAHEWDKDRVSRASTNKLFSASANYDFNAFRLYGGLQSARNLTASTGNLTGIGNWTITGPTRFTATRLDAYTVGVAVPVGLLTLGTNYSHTRYSNASIGYELGRIAVGAKYDLSKQTALYAGLSTATADLKEYIAEKRMIQLGIRKFF